MLRIWHDQYDWVIAETAEDASEAWSEHVGERRSADAEPWHEWTKTGRFNLDDGLGSREMSPEQILADHGRGFFASTEY